MCVGPTSYVYLFSIILQVSSKNWCAAPISRLSPDQKSSATCIHFKSVKNMLHLMCHMSYQSAPSTCHACGHEWGWMIPENPPGSFEATLPYEPVCTENLTPWLKLLPCGGSPWDGALWWRKRPKTGDLRWAEQTVVSPTNNWLYMTLPLVWDSRFLQIPAWLWGVCSEEIDEPSAVFILWFIANHPRPSQLIADSVQGWLHGNKNDNLAIACHCNICGISLGLGD